MNKRTQEYLAQSLGQALSNMYHGAVAEKTYRNWQQKYLPGGKPATLGVPYANPNETTLDESAMAELVTGLGSNPYAERYLAGAQGAFTQAQRMRDEEKQAQAEAERKREAEQLRQMQQRAGLTKALLDLHSSVGDTVNRAAIPQLARASQGLEDPQTTIRTPMPFSGAGQPGAPMADAQPTLGAEIPQMFREEPAFEPAPQPQPKVNMSDQVYNVGGQLFTLGYDDYGNPKYVPLPEGAVPYSKPTGGPSQPRLTISDLNTLNTVDERRMLQGTKASRLHRQREAITGIRVVKDQNGQEKQMRIGPGYPSQAELQTAMYSGDPEVVRQFNMKYGPYLTPPDPNGMSQLQKGAKTREEALDEWQTEFETNRAAHEADTRRKSQYETLITGQKRW